MALSMEEQRILAEIERQLSRDEPRLAARLSAFGHPGLATPLGPHRARLLACLAALALLVVVSMMAFSLLSLRAVPQRAPATPSKPVATASYPGGAATPP
jgi:hypothetical protein